MSSALERTVWVTPAAVRSNDLRLSTHGRTVPRPQPPISCMHCSHVPGAHSFWHSSNTQRSPIRASSYQPRIVIGPPAGRPLRSAHRSQWSTTGYVEQILLQPPQYRAPASLECVAWTWAEANLEANQETDHEANVATRCFRSPASRCGIGQAWSGDLLEAQEDEIGCSCWPSPCGPKAMAWAPNAISSSATPAVSSRLHGG